MRRLINLLFTFFICCVLPLQAFWWIKDWDPDAASKRVEVFGKQVAKKYLFEFLSDGVGTCVDSREVMYDLSLMSHHQWTIDQCRPYVVGMMQEFWDFISNDKIVLDYLKVLPKYQTRVRKLEPHRLGLKLAFWDYNVDRYKPPFVSRVIVAEGKIRYYMADLKDQHLLDPYVETMDDAIAKVLASQNANQ